jgi:hypothetical protein
MGLMEIAVGAIVGAMVGWPGLYLQRRMKRKDELEARVQSITNLTWEAAHQTESVLDALVRQRKSLGYDFYKHVNELGQRLHAQSMTMSSKFGPRVNRIARILRYMEPHSRVSDEKLTQVARDVIHHAQWVCAAYLFDKPIPDEPSYLRDYEADICPD